MHIYSRYTILGAAAGVLVLSATQRLPSQQRPTAAERDMGGMAQQQDTSMARQDTSMAKHDSSTPHKAGKKAKKGAGYTGAPTDTALKAKPGVQTGATDTGKAGMRRPADSMKDTTRSR